MKKMIFNIIVISSTAIILLMLIFFTNGVDELVHLMETINYQWIAAAFSCMVLYWIIGGVILHIITTSLFEKYKLGDSMKLNMIGHFFNAITPFSTGGQPMQVYIMTKKRNKDWTCSINHGYQVDAVFHCIIFLHAGYVYF
jgi:uncharacterized protein (TIRG00374 family)